MPRALAALLLTLLVGAPARAIEISSPAFPPDGAIPARFTCQGADISPALQFTGVPKGTKSLVLVVLDPDAPDPAAPGVPFTHWLLYEIPPGTRGLSESADSQLPQGTRAGMNDWNRTRWGGPCPPTGRHRYVFRLYALDAALGDLHEPGRAALEAALEGHVLARAEMTGTFEKAP